MKHEETRDLGHSLGMEGTGSSYWKRRGSPSSSEKPRGAVQAKAGRLQTFPPSPSMSGGSLARRGLPAPEAPLRPP